MYIFFCISIFPPLWSLCTASLRWLFQSPLVQHGTICSRVSGRPLEEEIEQTTMPGQREVEQATFNSQHWVCVSIVFIRMIYTYVMILYSLDNLCRGHVFRSFLNSLDATCVFIMDAEMGDAAISYLKSWMKTAWELSAAAEGHGFHRICHQRSQKLGRKGFKKKHFCWTNQR